MMCRVLEVSRAGYYAWKHRPESQRSRTDRVLTASIREVHERNRRTYGSPRVYQELKATGHRVGRHRVARLMRQERLVGCKRRGFVATTDSKHDHPVAENLLARRFEASAPNQVWVGDITYLPTAEGWLYLAILLDLWSRKIVGWAMSASLDASVALAALRMALEARNPAAGLMHHSDRGVQYACETYQATLHSNDLVPSMSRKGNCWDNAPAESFFGTLKTELLAGRIFPSRAIARTEVFEYIEAFYNRRRRHSTLGYLSPGDFETQCNR